MKYIDELQTRHNLTPKRENFHDFNFEKLWIVFMGQLKPHWKEKIGLENPRRIKEREKFVEIEVLADRITIIRSSLRELGWMNDFKYGRDKKRIYKSNGITHFDFSAVIELEKLEPDKIKEVVLEYDVTKPLDDRFENIKFLRGIY